MTNKRKPLDDTFEKRFVFGDSPASSPSSEPAKIDNPTQNPWAELKADEREPTIRLNVDIPLSLNDKLAEKARKLRKPKTELVRRLLEWALDESSE